MPSAKRSTLITTPRRSRSPSPPGNRAERARPRRDPVVRERAVEVTARRAGTTAVVSGVSGTGLASPSTIIRPSGARPNLGEVWAYRELVYFLRLVIPLATILAGLVDFAIAFVVGIGLMAWYGIVPGPSIAAVPLFVALAVLTALAAGLWLSALNVEYRDVRYTLGFLVQIWLFATPVAYPSSLVPERWRALYGLNPMAGVVEGFRWALLGHGQPPGALLVVSTTVTFVVLAGGLWYFKRMERTFADVV